MKGLAILVFLSLTSLQAFGEDFIDYDTGIEMVKDSIRQGELRKAEDLLRRILHHYPGNPEALSMLGHDLEFCGRVVRGKGIGKRLGFPTINVKLPAGKIIPPAGVYAAYNLIGSAKRYGMMYVGGGNPEFAFEVNLFDFKGDLYGEKVSVYPTQFIRQSIRFDDEGKLVKQIEEDAIRIRNLFKLV